ncbi:MAG: tetratricopeptide repeat protein [Candidatus Omnitrophica bacterium]|nr:tetratricopeptide repeat protein [Candidatus Omnitrophota bacterium]
MTLSDFQKQADFFFEKAFEHQKRGEFKEAVGCYKKSLELHPTARAHTFLGWAYSLTGRFEEAMEECKKAIRIDPEFGNPYNDIGAYLIELGRLEEAVPWLERAIRARRYAERMFPFYNLGRIWEIKGRLPDAIRCYEEALRQNPTYLSAKTALSRVRALFN